jgi:phosphate starvation-inducible membrane PsiE
MTMNLEKLSQFIFRYKVFLFLICVAVIINYLDNRPKALSFALIFMSLSSIGDIILGYHKNKAGMGWVSSLLVPAVMFFVFMSLGVFMLIKVV